MVVAVAVPLGIPHDAAVVTTFVVSTEEFVMVTISTAKQPEAAVTVTPYTPAHSPAAVCVV